MVLFAYYIRTDSENWKEFISKPGLPYVLRLLTGLSTDHENTQVGILVYLT